MSTLDQGRVWESIAILYPMVGHSRINCIVTYIFLVQLLHTNEFMPCVTFPSYQNKIKKMYGHGNEKEFMEIALTFLKHITISQHSAILKIFELYSILYKSIRYISYLIIINNYFFIIIVRRNISQYATAYNKSKEESQKQVKLKKNLTSTFYIQKIKSIVLAYIYIL
jgi:hypothetical protein